MPLLQSTHSDAPPQADFHVLAKRISAWTSRGLLSGLVVVAGVGFGRQTVRWWRAESVAVRPADDLSLLVDALLAPERSQLLQFGDLTWQCRRQSITGTREDAARALRAECRQGGDVARDGSDCRGEGPMMTRSPAPISDRLAFPAEDRLLRALVHRKPTEVDRAGRQLYQFEGDLPLVVVTQPASGQQSGAECSGCLPEGRETGAVPFRAERQSDQEHVALACPRVVTWAIGLPKGDLSWTLYTFRPAVGGNGQLPGFPQIGLPPNGTRIFSLFGSQGGGIVTYKGVARTEAWELFFDDWFQRHGWKASERWCRCGVASFRWYSPPKEDTAGRIGVHLRGGDRGELTALVLVNKPEPMRSTRP